MVYGKDKKIFVGLVKVIVLIQYISSYGILEISLYGLHLESDQTVNYGMTHLYSSESKYSLVFTVMPGSQ